jgi:predicted AlkP superfamily pyrophosphatase or phosphodiesterase
MKKICSVIIVTVILQLFATAPAAISQKTVQAAAGSPKLVLAIVVDQFRYDYLLRFGSDYRDGLQQLMTKGAVFANAQYDHFPTFTSVGHAAFLTGAYPSVTGIIGNQWYDRESGKVIGSVFDDSVQPIGGSGRSGASPHNLLVSTIGDELKMANRGQSRVFGISLKDYAAILAAGRSADGVFWYDSRNGNFASSTYYAPDLPAWVKEFNAKKIGDRYLGKEWVGGKLPAGPGPNFNALMISSPFGNVLVEEMAEETIKAEKLGQDSFADLLVLSFSSNDMVGHFYGPDSPQVRDVSINMDQVLGKLFRFLEARVGMANVAVVFTADHGVAPVPEANAARKMPGGRISFPTISDAVQKSLTEKYGEGNWVLSAPEDAIYLNWDLMKSKKLVREDVYREAVQVILTLPHVFRAYTREQLMNGAVEEDRVGRRVLNGFSQKRGADVYVLFDPYYFSGKLSTTHGTAFGYDTHVPVIFMGPGIRKGTFYSSISVSDIAPTLATVLGIEIPSGSEGRILSEILVAP